MKYYFILILFSASSSLFSQEQAWELVSMNPPRGSISEFYSSNNKEYFISGYFGILYSSDNCESWNLFLDNNFQSMIVVEGDLYTRCKEIIEGQTRFGIYKSTDYGESWKDITGNWDRRNSIYKFIQDSNIIYSVVFNPLGNDSIFCTSDKGENWNFISYLEKNPSIRQYKTFNVYRNVFISIADPSNNEGIIFNISKNYGKSWEVNYLKDKYIYRIKIKSESEYFISTRDGIWLTTDYGNTWELKWLGGISVYSFDFTNDLKEIYANIYPFNNFLIDRGIIFSTDSGLSWKLSSEFLELNENQNLINIIEVRNENIYATPQYLGLIKSDNKGNRWSESNNGFSGMAASDFLFIDTSIFMSCWGVFKSTDAGSTFDYLDLKKYDTGPIRRNSKGMLFVDDNGTGGTRQGIMRSDDGGRTWKSLYSNIRTLAFIINKRDVILTATLGNLQRSIDDGETWEYIVPPLAEALGTNDEGDFFVFSYDYPGGPEGQGIWRSTDDGVTWDSISCKTINSVNGRIIFNNYTKTAWFGPTFNETTNIWAIHKTTDNGRTWYVEDLKEKGYDWYPSGSQVAVDSLGFWVAARDGEKYGIYRSCDNGATWIREDTTGLPKEFGPIGVSPDGRIYVFGGTGGLYRSTKKYVSVEQRIKENIYNIIVFPNPAQEMIKVEIPIHYRMNPDPWMIMMDFKDEFIEIFDILGNRVKMERPNLEGFLEYGNDVEVDISSLPAGVYYLRYGRLSQKFVKM